MAWSRYAYLTLAILWSAGTAAEPLSHFPGAETVETEQDTTIVARRVILGSLKKIKNVLEPGKVEYVTGSRQSVTLYIPNERRSTRVRDYYRNQLQQSGSILFECSGRECGSSNYWANTVFSRSVLYGPEQFQHYSLARLDGTGDHVAVYVAVRGTGKLYVHVETIVGRAQAPRGSAPGPNGRQVFVGDDAPAIAEEVSRHMKQQPEMVVHLVVHRGVTGNEVVSDIISETQAMAERLRALVIAEGVASDRIHAKGLGPLAPSKEYGADRVEALVFGGG